MRDAAVASGHEEHVKAYLDARTERERRALPKISAHHRAGLDAGSTPNEVEDSERAFKSTFGDKATLDGPGVHRLLGVDGEGLQVRASVKPADGGGLKIESVLTDKDGKHVGSLNRTYARGPDGALRVHHDYFVLADDQKGKGLGGRVIAKQLDQYESLGVGHVDTLAAWDGRYVWPKMGFELSDPGEAKLLQKRWKSYLSRTGQAYSPVSSVQDVVAHPSGKAFLLGSRAPMLHLTATPATLKAKINAKRKTTT